MSRAPFAELALTMSRHLPLMPLISFAADAVHFCWTRAVAGLDLYPVAVLSGSHRVRHIGVVLAKRGCCRRRSS